MLGGDGEEERFDAWLRSQSEVATFFLDSIDELKLTLGKFDQALKRLNKALTGHLGRARIIITTRPVPIDRELIVRNLPIPESREAGPTAEAFADMVMNQRENKPVSSMDPKTWRNVGLMPLSREQMHAFAVVQGVSDPDALLADISQRDAARFAERPQDLIELCADWREHHRIRSHREQVKTSIETKSKPNTERREGAELSQAAAIEGASRLALAAILTRKLTFRYSAEADRMNASEAALDVSKILQNWGANARATLLQRPLFGFASYGRVRFHHRSVMEFLAAERLNAMLARGDSIKSIKRILFTETAQGARAVRPSMRPVAAWLALSRDSIFGDIIALDPAVVLDHGDPQSLRPEQRVRALEAYVDRYGRGGWRGLSVPRIQVHRLASQELTDSLKRLWNQGIENPEVREFLLQIVAAGKLRGCADIAYAVAIEEDRTVLERSLAIEALLQLNDLRLEPLAGAVAIGGALWPDAMARRAVLDLFPTYMPIVRLSQILQRVREQPSSVGDLGYRLPRKIEATGLSAEYLDQLRQALTDLITEGLQWEPGKFPQLRTKRPDLMAALIAACRRQAAEEVRTESWVESTLIAVRLSDEDHSEKDALAELRRALAGLPMGAREAAFWNEDAFLARLRQSRDPWHRVFDLSHYGGIQFSDEIDAAWVRKRLSDPNEPLDHREMMLLAEISLLNRGATDHRELLEGLKQFVSDVPSLTAIIDNRLKQQEVSADLRRMRAESAKHAKQADRDTAKARASWVTFWHKVARDPDAVFGVDRAQNTAWDLWQAVQRSGRESRASGWNRRFIEEQFGKVVADRLRETMMAAWRKDRPTLRSERPEAEKDRFLVRWQFGLAGIAAEAEDANWAKRLSEQEVELACRYAPLQLNGFPWWLESLVADHPAVVDRVLGEEISLSLREVVIGNAYSMFMQNISYASAIVAALFVPRIRAWLSEVTQVDAKPNNTQFEHNLRQAIEILVKNGNDTDHRFIETMARQRLAGGLAVPFVNVWLSALLGLNVVAGIDVLEAGLAENTASKPGTGVQLFAELFARGDSTGVDLRAPGFTPSLLLRLLRLAYKHVRVEDDAHHEGVYSPDKRDNAEHGRSAVLGALFSASGPDGWAVKLEMATDPLFAHIKDRAIALAEERAAEEADNDSLTEAEFAILDQTGESPPATRDAMFALMRDRLDDIDDLLLQDISPRELWASITNEHLMRRELARALRDTGNQSYTIDQESVTADENETDIRFRSTGSKQQGTIELKLADNRSGTDLFNTIRDQLLTKYMAADDCRAGCLLVAIAKDREWDHPKTGKRIGFEELMNVLNEEADRLSKELGGAAKLMAKGLDLRPRLGTKRGRAP